MELIILIIASLLGYAVGHTVGYVCGKFNGAILNEN